MGKLSGVCSLCLPYHLPGKVFRFCIIFSIVCPPVMWSKPKYMSDFLINQLYSIFAQLIATFKTFRLVVIFMIHISQHFAPRANPTTSAPLLWTMGIPGATQLEVDGETVTRAPAMLITLPYQMVKMIFPNNIWKTVLSIYSFTKLNFVWSILVIFMWNKVYRCIAKKGKQ